VFARLRAAGHRVTLLESVVGGERWGRYSVIGVDYRARLVGTLAPRDPAADPHAPDELDLAVEVGTGFHWPESLPRRGGLALIRAVLAAFRAAAEPALPRFWGGLLGVWGHDVVRAFEHLPRPAAAESAPLSLGLPAVDLLLTDTLVVFDNLSKRVTVVATAHPPTDGGELPARAAARERVSRLTELLVDDGGPDLRPRGLPALALVDDAAFEGAPTRPWSSERMRRAVARGLEFIRAGDVFQVVLSQRFEVARAGLDPLDVYRILRVTNPAPYMYLLELPSATLVGASPEVLVRVDRDTRRLTVRPIAGTRRRGATPEEDAALERELLADPKERAEHLMLIDLGRNDVGRVAVGGSVRIEESFVVERYSRVMHLVSEVSGLLPPELDALDALRATFPAGTLSGAPKLRALQIIDELELGDRGWYGGAVGYLAYDGGADFAICIRSMVATADTLSVQAGGGVVFDSTPALEDEESRNKASAVLRAIAMARAGRAASAAARAGGGGRP
jgi:anthranilate synthase component 1